MFLICVDLRSDQQSPGQLCVCDLLYKCVKTLNDRVSVKDATTLSSTLQKFHKIDENQNKTKKKNPAFWKVYTYNKLCHS